MIIPTHDNGEPIRHALASASGQTVADIEIFVVGDGTTDLTRTIVGQAMAQDDRIRFFDNPKGPRHGELWRHRALADARGEIVCYLCDDDLWFPDHVATASDLLADADFAHTRVLRQFPDQHYETFVLDLTQPRDLLHERTRQNRIPLSGGTHTLEAYRRLPHGWRTTPTGINTDWYMWRQFLDQPWFRARSGTWPTYLHLANSDWLAVGPDGEASKNRAIAAWAARLEQGIDDEERLRLTVDALEWSWAVCDYFERRWRNDLDHILATRWWRGREHAKRVAREVLDRTRSRRISRDGGAPAR